MSLSGRQLQMLIDLCEIKDDYLTSNYFSQKYDISIRTVQNDISAIKIELKTLKFLELIAIPSKGSKILIKDNKEYQRYIDKSTQSVYADGLNSKEARIKKIISILLCSKKAISAQHLADRLFVSKSTLMSDIKQAEDILENYHIKIKHHNQTGYYVQGKESNIRKCISKEHIDILKSYNDLLSIGQVSPNFKKIGDILVNLFTEYRFQISDVVLQNLIVHIDILILRIEMGFVMETIQIEDMQNDFAREIEIAERLFLTIHKVFHIPVIQAEVNRLAIYLRGKSNYSDDSYITQEIDDFVLETLMIIEQKYGIAFVDNVQLRVSLSLHLIPLLTRLKYNMQLKNDLLHSMRTSFQVAMDIASSFSYRIKEVFGYTLSEDEISYLAIYFNSALESQQIHEGTNRMLIISSLKRSETLLLRERINSWFSNAISELKIEDIYHIDDFIIDDYDVVCTTEKNQYYQDHSAILISQFPTDEDYRNIKMALDGFSGKEEILSLFKKDNFFIGKTKDKDTLLRKLCECIGENDEEREALQNEVMNREAMGGTIFGSLVAMPHPMYPITQKTYISIALLDKEIKWDDYGNHAQLILLISLEKNNPRAYRIWSYLTEFISDDKVIEAILKERSYEAFMNQLSVSLDKIKK